MVLLRPWRGFAFLKDACSGHVTSLYEMQATPCCTRIGRPTGQYDGVAHPAPFTSGMVQTRDDKGNVKYAAQA